MATTPRRPPGCCTARCIERAAPIDRPTTTTFEQRDHILAAYAPMTLVGLPVAWLAILLGFAMETLLLLITAGFGIFPGLKPVAADLVRQVSWSTIVCVGSPSELPPPRPARR